MFKNTMRTKNTWVSRPALPNVAPWLQLEALAAWGESVMGSMGKSWGNHGEIRKSCGNHGKIMWKSWENHGDIWEISKRIS